MPRVERIAQLLHRTGALAATMRLRGLTRVPIVTALTFHHVADADPGYEFDAEVADATVARFREQVETLARYGTIIGIDELIDAINGGPLPPNPCMITFDDGYRSCIDVALPILSSVGAKAVFFVATSYVTERRLYWWERIAVILRQAKRRHFSLTYPTALEIDARSPKGHRTLTEIVKSTDGLDLERFLTELARACEVEWNPTIEREATDRLIMTWDQIRQLSKAGMDIESHSRRHRVLQTLPPDQVRDELLGSRLDIEAQLGKPARAIAYPVGRTISAYPEIRAAVKAAGYQLGFSNASGVNRFWRFGSSMRLPLGPAVDPFDLKRLASDRDMSQAMFLGQVAVPRLAYISRNHHR